MWAALVALLLFAQKTDFYAEGMKALEAEKYETAIENFTKAIEGDPKDYTAHFNLALAYSLIHKDAAAIPLYRRVLELKPGLYEAELNLGILLLRDKQPHEAVEPLESAATQKPSEFRPAFYAAEALLADGNPEKAEHYYRLATDLDPKSAPAELGLARALAKQDHLPEAAEHFRKAAELDASYRDNLLELASLYESHSQPQEAMAIYTQFPEQIGAQERLGELLLEAKRPAEAIPHLEWAVQKSPTAANRLALATAYLKNNQTEKAMPLLQQAVEAEPGDTDLRMTYGRTLRDEKKYQAAAAEFWRVAQAKPDSAEAWSELAGMLIMLENYPQALAALDRVKALGAEKAGHYFFRAIILDKTKQFQPALENYEKFLALSEGKNPDQEFQARQRVRIIQKELSRR